MKILLIILSCLSFISGSFSSIMATTIFQQIVGGISFIIAAIFFIGAGIVSSLDKIYIELKLNKEGDPLRVLQGAYKCKHCNEVIRIDDKICPYCKESLV